jgi:hypothetical protein
MGPIVLERVTAAARRNRSRILILAAEALGLSAHIQTVSDQSNHEDDLHKTIIMWMDVQSNTLRPPMTHLGEAGTHWIYAAGAVDSVISQGLASCSNVADGYVIFRGEFDSAAVRVRNSASDCIPFGSRKNLTTSDAVQVASTREGDGVRAHGDHEWLSTHFGWKRHPSNKSSGVAWEVATNMEPVQLWGTHDPEDWIGFSRELSIDSLQAIRLNPEIVALGGTEAAKLRAVGRHLSEHVK